MEIQQTYYTHNSKRFLIFAVKVEDVYGGLEDYLNSTDTEAEAFEYAAQLLKNVTIIRVDVLDCETKQTWRIDA